MIILDPGPSSRQWKRGEEIKGRSKSKDGRRLNFHGSVCLEREGNRRAAVCFY